MKVNLILVAFYTFYWLFLRKNTFFQANRFYLISSVFVSFILPLIKIKHNYAIAKPLPLTLNEIPIRDLQPILNQVVIDTNNALPLNWFDIISMIYWAGVAYLGLRFMYSIIRVFYTLHQSEPLDFVETYTGTEYWLLENQNENSSYSFFNFLVLNKDDLRNHQSIITDHEEVHINQKHSWDIVFLEFVHIFCWFNPIVFFYKKSIKLLHEFYADQFVNSLQPADYAQFLFAYNFRTNVSHLSNDFFRSSLLKERIKMLVRDRSSNFTWTSYLFVFPFFVLISYFIMAQNIDRNSSKTPTIQAAPVGGFRALEKYIANEFKFPSGKNDLFGIVYANFIVTTKGKIENLQIERAINENYNASTVDCLSKMSDWQPAEIDNLVISSKVFIKITFGRAYGIIVENSSKDFGFRGVALNDGNEFDFGDILFSEDFVKYFENPNLKDGGSLILEGYNSDLVEKYGQKAQNGVGFFMFKKFPLLIFNGVEENMKGYATSRKVENADIMIYDERAGITKFGEKAKHGAIVINDIKKH